MALGFVPFGGVGQQLLDAGEVLPHGTPQARFGFAVGQIVGGIATMAGGVGGDVLGGAATVTGIGAAVGVPAMVVSTTLVVGGAGNVAAGIQGLMTTGSGSSGPQKTIDPNRLNHIFGQSKHKLGPLVERFGSQEAAFNAVESATQVAARTEGLTGLFKVTVQVDGFDVVVKGAVVDDGVRIGTFWIQ